MAWYHPSLAYGVCELLRRGGENDLRRRRMNAYILSPAYEVEAVTALWVSMDEWMDWPSSFDKVSF